MQLLKTIVSIVCINLSYVGILRSCLLPDQYELAKAVQRYIFCPKMQRFVWKYKNNLVIF